jgi:hypothetical protein
MPKTQIKVPKLMKAVRSMRLKKSMGLLVRMPMVDLGQKMTKPKGIYGKLKSAKRQRTSLG